MDDLRRQRDQLEKELQGASEALSREHESMASTWQVGLGSRTVKAKVNVVLIAAGIAFIFLNGTFRVLGISLVVGGLFSCGTFMTQWWNHAWQRQKDTIDRTFNFGYHDRRYAELQRLAKEYIKLYDKLEGLPEPPSQDNSTGISKEEPDPPGPSA